MNTESSAAFVSAVNVVTACVRARSSTSTLPCPHSLPPLHFVERRKVGNVQTRPRDVLYPVGGAASMQGQSCRAKADNVVVTNHFFKKQPEQLPRPGCKPYVFVCRFFFFQILPDRERAGLRTRAVDS